MPIFIEQIADPIAADFNDLVKIYTDYPLHGHKGASSDDVSLWLREQLGAATITLYAARFNGRLLGALWIQKNKADAHWALEHLCVRGLTRRRGVADMLIGEVLLYAQQAGAKVVINDLVPERVEEVVSKLKTAGHDVTGFPANVATADGAEALVAAAIDAYGRVDILVNNVGMARDGWLPKKMATIHPKTRTPHIAIIVTSLILVSSAVLLPINELGSAASIMFLLVFL